MDGTTKRKTKTSAAVKNRYNAKVYGTMTVRLPKQLTADFKAACIERGVSQSQVIKAAVEAFLAE